MHIKGTDDIHIISEIGEIIRDQLVRIAVMRFIIRLINVDSLHPKLKPVRRPV